MIFSQTVYYNDKPLVLVTDKEQHIKDNPAAGAYSVFEGATIRSFTQALQHLDRPGIMGVMVEDASGDALLDQLTAIYSTIDAGGGIAYNEEGAILMIYRRGKWDLPKGKLDKGEDIEACALREVSEETGLNNITLGDKICDTYHIYAQSGDQYLKRTAWYKMKGSAAQKLKPQKEENIIEARWVKETEIAPLAAKSYEAIRDVMRKAGLKW